MKETRRPLHRLGGFARGEGKPGEGATFLSMAGSCRSALPDPSFRKDARCEQARKGVCDGV